VGSESLAKISAEDRKTLTEHNTVAAILKTRLQRRQVRTCDRLLRTTKQATKNRILVLLITLSG
jgi:hypothetical protein